jgi:hypothetical protein
MLHILLNIMFNRIYQRDYFVFCIGTVLQLLIKNDSFVITMLRISPIFVMLGFYITFMEHIILITLLSLPLRFGVIQLNLCGAGGEIIGYQESD